MTAKKNGSIHLEMFLDFSEESLGVRGVAGERSEASPQRTAPPRPGRRLLCSCPETTLGHRACLSPARSIRLGLLEGMNRRGGHTLAIRDVLLVLLLPHWTIRFACPIGRQAEVFLLGHAQQIHALLCEEILPM